MRPVIPFEPREDEFRPVDLGCLSEDGLDQMRLPVLARDLLQIVGKEIRR